jgi:hypothetical protein
MQAGYLVLIGDRRGQRTQWASVGDALVRPVSVIEAFELAQGVEQVALVPDQRPSSNSRRQVCAQRSMIEFIRRIRTPLSKTSIPAPFGPVLRARGDAAAA